MEAGMASEPEECDIATADDVSGVDGYEAGHQAGFEAGKEALRPFLQKEYEERLEQERQRIDVLLAGIQEQSDRLRRQFEQSIIKLSVVVAEQILKREVALDDQTVIRQIREALRRVAGVERITVRVNPGDEPLVRGSRPGILAGADAIRDILIESDDKVEPGGCILESDLGNIDARLSSQMKKIEEALLSRENPAATS
jgi:flagellar assembly protein FliH